MKCRDTLEFAVVEKMQVQLNTLYDDLSDYTKAKDAMEEVNFEDNEILGQRHDDLQKRRDELNAEIKVLKDQAKRIGGGGGGGARKKARR